MIKNIKSELQPKFIAFGALEGRQNRLPSAESEMAMARQKLQCSDSQLRRAAEGGVLSEKYVPYTVGKLWKSAFQCRQNHLNRSCKE